MFGFTKTPLKVVVGEQLCEILEVLVKVRTPVGEFYHTATKETAGVVLKPGDSITWTWTWNGFKSV